MDLVWQYQDDIGQDMIDSCAIDRILNPHTSEFITVKSRSNFQQFINSLKEQSSKFAFLRKRAD